MSDAVSNGVEPSRWVELTRENAGPSSWYVERFLSLRASVFSNRASYFHKYAALSDEDAAAEARRIWREINGLNLHENVLPTRERAQLILEKAPDHRIASVRLRKI